MIVPLKYNVDLSLIKKAADSVNINQFKSAINKPTGRFFYDPWVLKDEFKNSVWEEILNTLPVNIGEARIIVLNPATCYQIHSDIDDRYHLNIQSEAAYLIDLENNVTLSVTQDGIWYEMNAGRLHSAANMGRLHRIQLVVRKLLNDNKIRNPLTIKITSTLSPDDSRFFFDQTVSKWLNKANKLGYIADFVFESTTVKFSIEKIVLEEFKSILTNDFKMEII